MKRKLIQLIVVMVITVFAWQDVMPAWPDVLRPRAMAERQRIIEDVSDWDSVMAGDIVRLREGDYVRDFEIIPLRSSTKHVKFARVVGGSRKRFALKLNIGDGADTEAECFEVFNNPGHPNLIKGTAMVDAADNVVIVTEHIGRANRLDRWINKIYKSGTQASVLPDIVNVLIQELDAIEYTHSKRVVLLDIQQHNAFVLPKSNQLVILDFEDAEFFDEHTPKQVKNYLEVSFFDFLCTAYFCLTGQKIDFDQFDQDEVTIPEREKGAWLLGRDEVRMSADVVPSPRDINSSVPTELNDAMLSILRKDPAKITLANLMDFTDAFKKAVKTIKSKQTVPPADESEGQVVKTGIRAQPGTFPEGTPLRDIEASI